MRIDDWIAVIEVLKTYHPTYQEIADECKKLGHATVTRHALANLVGDRKKTLDFNVGWGLLELLQLRNSKRHAEIMFNIKQRSWPQGRGIVLFYNKNGEIADELRKLGELDET